MGPYIHSHPSFPEGTKVGKYFNTAENVRDGSPGPSANPDLSGSSTRQKGERRSFTDVVIDKYNIYLYQNSYYYRDIVGNLIESPEISVTVNRNFFK